MVKRKRHAKVKHGLNEFKKQKEAKLEKEFTEISKVVKKARKDFKIQKRKLKNAPKPIPKRKDRGYEGIEAGMRQEIEKRVKESAEKKAQAKVEKPRKETGNTSLKALLGEDFFQKE